jgi:hypothetical protein
MYSSKYVNLLEVKGLCLAFLASRKGVKGFRHVISKHWAEYNLLMGGLDLARARSLSTPFHTIALCVSAKMRYQNLIRKACSVKNESWLEFSTCGADAGQPRTALVDRPTEPSHSGFLGRGPDMRRSHPFSN